MNKVELTGRLTRDPAINYSQGENSTCIARFGLAVDRRFKREGQQNVDFINCVAFGKQGEFVQKYLKQGTKIALVGRIQTGSYTNRDGVKVYTTDIIAEEMEFIESKATAQAHQNQQAQPQVQPQPKPQPQANNNDFMAIPDGFESEMPFI